MAPAYGETTMSTTTDTDRWHLRGSDIRDGSGLLVASNVHEADARLILAVHDMLKLLKNVCEGFEPYSDDTRTTWWEARNATIAKAEAREDCHDEPPATIDDGSCDPLFGQRMDSADCGDAEGRS